MHTTRSTSSIYKYNPHDALQEEEIFLICNSNPTKITRARSTDDPFHKTMKKSAYIRQASKACHITNALRHTAWSIIPHCPPQTLSSWKPSDSLFRTSVNLFGCHFLSYISYSSSSTVAMTFISAEEIDIRKYSQVLLKSIAKNTTVILIVTRDHQL